MNIQACYFSIHQLMDIGVFYFFGDYEYSAGNICVQVSYEHIYFFQFSWVYI